MISNYKKEEGTDFWDKSWTVTDPPQQDQTEKWMIELHFWSV